MSGHAVPPRVATSAATGSEPWAGAELEPRFVLSMGGLLSHGRATAGLIAAFDGRAGHVGRPVGDLAASTGTSGPRPIRPLLAPSAGARRGPGVTGIQLSRRRSRRCMFEDEDRDVVMVILAAAVAPRAPSGQACVHRPPPQPGRHLREAGSRLRTAEGPRASSRARCTSVVADHAAVPFHGETVSGSTSSPACGCRAAPRLAASASVATEWTPGGAHGTSRRRAWVFRDARNRQVLRRSGTRPQGARRMPHRVR